MWILFLFLVAVAAEPPAENRANLTIAVEPLGDAPGGVATRVDFRFSVPNDVPPGIPLVIVGSATQSGTPRTFRYLVRDDQRTSLSSIQTFAPVEVEIEARLMIPLEEETPVILGKTTAKFPVVATNRPYVAGEEATAEAVIAEGTVPEGAGSVRIVPPRRDVAPNLFIVEVEVKPPVKRVEFWVDGKKLMTRNAPPYRAELDLGALPKRVEVRAVGYDARGRYVDADAFVVNERETPLEVKITRTVTPDGVSHFRVALQNAKGRAIRSVTLFAGQRKIAEWKRPPYAIDIPAERLAGVEFVRVSAVDETSYEATDLLFLSGDRYMERVDVNLVELPLSVVDAAGAPVSDLKESEVHVFEDGKRQKISSFSHASNLPLSIGLVIDHSGSMKPRMKATREAAAEFLRSVIKGQDRAFVAGFAFEAAKVAPFTSDVAALGRQVEAIPEPEGGTSLHDAIITGLYRFRSLQGRKALVILTDGEDTTSRIPYEELLTYVRSARVPLYFIAIGMGFGDLGGTMKIKSLAAETGAGAYFIRGVKELKETYERLEADLRSQYLVAYYSESAANDTRYRTVEVKVDRPDANVRTIRGYIP